MSDFDPSHHLMQLSRRAKNPDGSWRTVEHPYLEVKWRIVWLRSLHPDATITTELIADVDSTATFRAEVTLPTGASATGWGKVSKDKWADYLEKCETRALGRALAALGYGTEFCDDEDCEEANLAATAPQPRDKRPEPTATRQASAKPSAATPATTAAASPRQKDTRGTSPHKMLTPAQLSAIYAQAERYGVSRTELARRIAQHFDGLAPEALTVAQANDCLAGLRQLAPA